MINDLIYDLLCQLGLEISSDHKLLQQDTKSLILLNGKLIRFSYDGIFMIDSNEEIWLDPLNNEELSSKFFNMFKVVLMKSENVRILSENEVNDNGSPKRFLQIKYVKDNEKQTFTSNPYNNFALAYLETIFAFSGLMFDFRQLD